MIEVNVIKLEDNKEYAIINTLEKNQKKYLLLVEVNNEENVCIRRVLKEDEKEYLVKLDSNEEFEEVLSLFGDNLK